MVEARLSRGSFGAGADAEVPSAGGRQTGPSLEDDERGQLLILTGVLLVLGFVMLGATFIELQTLSETSERVQRDGVVDPIRDLVEDFNSTIIQTVGLGQTNIGDFQVAAERSEQRMREAAVRSGMYVSVELNPDPDTSIFFRESRCLAYDSFYTQDGVIIGYEHPSMQQTIVGAVYTIEITDGRQQLEMDYYVKIFECMLDDALVYPIDNQTQWGNSYGFPDLLDPADNNAAFVMQEQLTGTTVYETAAEYASTQGVFWSNPERIKADDGLSAEHPASNVVDHLQWQWSSPPDMVNGYYIQDVDIVLEAKELLTLLSTSDDVVRIAAYEDATQAALGNHFWSDAIPITESFQTFPFNDLVSPSGTADWTKDEWDTTVWRIYADEVLFKDAGRKFYIDHVTANIDYSAPTRSQLEERLEWDTIPYIYTTHTLHLSYMSSGEHFRIEIQVDDPANPGEKMWQTLGSDLSATSWTAWSAVLPHTDLTANEMYLRVIDLDDADGTPAQRDTLSFDYVYVLSELPDP